VIPTGISSDYLYSPVTAVSCAHPWFCVVTGTAYDPNSGLNVNDSAVWNGRDWRPAADPPGGAYALSCVPGSGCLAVGPGMAARWGKGDWYTPPIQSPAGSLTAVSCTNAASQCMAVGTNGGSEYQPHPAFAERWNGRTWKVTAMPPTAIGLQGVSCPRPDRCIAVGTAGNLATAVAWNGKAWRLLAVPDR
jgi:hypothetical protein